MNDVWNGIRKTLRIVGKRYKLQVVEKIDDEDSYGEHDYSKQTMKVREDQGFEAARDSLLHEAVHGVDEQMDIDLKEHQVRKLATGMLALMRDNPWFVAWLMEDEPEEKEPTLETPQ